MARLASAVSLSGMPAVDLRVRRPSIQGYLLQAKPSSSGMPLRTLSGSVARSEHNWDDLWKAYLMDGYIHRAVTRLRNLLIGRGVRLVGAADVVRYLNERFAIARSVNGIGWDELLRMLALDFVLYGNALAVRAHTTQLKAIYGRRILVPRATAAWYPVSIRYMTPNVSDKSGEVVSWVLSASIGNTGKRNTVELPARDVVHLAYNRVDYLYGTPTLVAVIEDIRALRQIEEDVLRLIHKFAYPILHIATPDTLGYGEGIRNDMQQLAYTINTMMEDGVLITMPGQEVRMVGAESIALRLEPYLELFKRRVFSGLGMSETMLADKPEPLERQVELERQLRDVVHDLQTQFGSELMQHLIRPLLDEAGYRNVELRLEFDIPDRQAELRLMTVLANLYALNVLSAREVREMMGITDPLDKRDTYNWNVNMPRLLEPIRLQSQLGAGRYTGDRARPDDKVRSPVGRKPGALAPQDEPPDNA